MSGLLGLLGRFGAVLVALALVVEAVIPQRVVLARVTGHQKVEQERRDTSWDHRTVWHHTTEYRVGIAGGLSLSCDVGPSAYDALQDGDEVVVDVTRLRHECVRVTRTSDQRIFDVAGAWRIVHLGAAVVLCLFAFGGTAWIPFYRWFGPQDGPVHDTRNRRRYR